MCESSTALLSPGHHGQREVLEVVDAKKAPPKRVASLEVIVSCPRTVTLATAIGIVPTVTTNAMPMLASSSIHKRGKTKCQLRVHCPRYIYEDSSLYKKQKLVRV